MWIGTNQGLNSFDGSEIYTWSDSKGQLGDRRIMGITEDKHQHLWLATFNGLSCFDLVTKKIDNYLSSSLDNHIHCLACLGDSIWMGNSEGLLLFDVRKKTFRQFTNTTVKATNMQYYFNNDVTAILIDSKKRIWAGTKNGLWLFDLNTHTYQQFINPPGSAREEMISALYEDKTGKLWEGCWSSGLREILPDRRTTKSYLNVPGMPTHVISIAEGTDNAKRPCLWLSGQLSKLSVQDLKIEPYILKPIAQAASLDAYCVYVSRDNLVWISTVKGIYILDPARQLFKHTFITAQNNITSQGPALYDDKNGFWLGGDNKCQLLLYDANFKVIRNYSSYIKKMGEPYSSMATMSIHPYAKNQLLLSTTTGIITIDTISGKITILSTGVVDSLNRKSSFINKVYIDKERMWCFPWRRGLWQYDKSAKKFVLIKMTLPESSGLEKNMNFSNAVPDRDGNIWLSDMDYGLVKYDKGTGKLQRIVNNNIPSYCRCVNICYIKNKLWLLANESVVEFDPLTKTSQSWLVPGNMSKFIYDYADDGEGNLWIATRNGLIVFNLTSHTFDQYTEEDGLLNNDLNGSLRMLKNGVMVYVGENYLTSFKPAQLLHAPDKKNLLLTRIIANDHDLILKQGIINIPAGIEKLTIKWAFLNYNNPLQNRYYNKLDGVDKDWNYAGTKGSAEYSGLPPGSYKFRYRAVTSDGLSFTEKVVSFTILPTFWQSWWFIASLVLLAFGCLLLIVHYVRVRERKRSALQLQLSALEMKALRAQMNPHFIFNALNSIQECIITKNTNTAYTYLSNFSKLVRMILENSEKQFITLEDEIESLRLYLSLEKLRFDETFEYNINIDPLIDTTFIQIPAMVIQPYVENALWHGLIHKKGKKTVTITFELQKGKLKCVIEDNGIGRDVAVQMQNNTDKVKKRSMGMTITEERLQLLEENASIIINDLYHENGEPAGTRVIIFLPLEF
jgi:ligand-binding sensor domain-containing protein